MTDQVHRRLSTALRAQAAGPGSAPGDQQGPPIGDEPARARRALPGWVVLAVAVLLGAMAGGLAGVISAW